MTNEVYCACCGGKPDDSNLGNYDEHCYSCEWRYHETKKENSNPEEEWTKEDDSKFDDLDEGVEFDDETKEGEC
jgi:hypothetical protein